MTEQSILDARLAEIDRRLRNIQSGLAPGGAEPAPPAPADARSGAADDVAAMRVLLAELRQITADHQRLLSSARELLADALARAPTAGGLSAAGPLGLSAGPFGSAAALRAFQRALLGLPEVRDVQVREYTGGDRVVVDVHLAQPTS